LHSVIKAVCTVPSGSMTGFVEEKKGAKRRMKKELDKN
jgi:hypothetical protein